MSIEKKAEHFDLALSLLLECRNYVLKSYWETPGRTKLLYQLDNFEKLLTADFSQKGE